MFQASLPIMASLSSPPAQQHPPPSSSHLVFTANASTVTTNGINVMSKQQHLNYCNQQGAAYLLNNLSAAWSAHPSSNLPSRRLQKQQHLSYWLGASPGRIQEYASATTPLAVSHNPMYQQQHVNQDLAHESHTSSFISNNNNNNINNNRFNDSIGHSLISNNINNNTNIKNYNNNNNSSRNNNSNINLNNNSITSNNCINNMNIEILNGASRTSSFNQPSSSSQGQHRYSHKQQQHNIQLVAPGSIFARRTDYKAFNALPKHKINTYHIKMEDDGSHGNDEVRWYILSNLSANKMSKACCIFCEKLLTIYDKYPLIDGAFFQSPIQHHKLSAKVRKNTTQSENQGNCSSSNSNWDSTTSQSYVNPTTANVSFNLDSMRAITTSGTTTNNPSSCSQPIDNCQELHQSVAPTNANSSEEAHCRSTGSFSSSHSSGIGSSLGGSCSSGNGSNFLASRSDSASSIGSTSALNGRKSSASSSSVTSSGFASAAASSPMPCSHGTTTSGTSSPCTTSSTSVHHSSVGRRIGPHAQAFAEKVKQQQEQQGQSQNQKSKPSPSQDKYINAICMACLEGWTYDIRCKFCYQPWIGTHFILGTMYNFDIFAAQPCCQARLSCNVCSKLVKMEPIASRALSSSTGENNKIVNSSNYQKRSSPSSTNKNGAESQEHHNGGSLPVREYFSHYSQRYRCENCDCKDSHFVKPISALYILKESEFKLSQSSEKSNNQEIVRAYQQQLLILKNQ